MKYLVTGGLGFLGSNLSKDILDNGHQLVIVDNLFRMGSGPNLSWLKTVGDFKHINADIKNAEDVNKILKTERPDIIYHVAGQVAMTTSLENPRLDFQTNVVGTFNLLNAVKDYCPEAVIIYSSTNKVYGDLEHFDYKESTYRYEIEQFPNGLNESIPLDFSTPYGCSKGAADQYMRDFHRSFNLKTVVFRHSSIFGGRQFATFDQGWIGWFVKQAIDTKNGILKDPFTINGNGKQVRDVLFSSDLISCYSLAVKHIEQTAGQIFNIGGGIENSLSLLELFKMLESKLNIHLSYKELPPRSSDQKFFVADTTKAYELFKWSPKISKESGIDLMIDWVSSSNK